MPGYLAHGWDGIENLLKFSYIIEFFLIQVSMRVLSTLKNAKCYPPAMTKIQSTGCQVRAQLLKVIGPRHPQESLQVLDGPVVATLRHIFAVLATFHGVLGLQQRMLKQEHGGQVGAGTLPHQKHLGGVAAVALDVLENPAHPAAHVLDHVLGCPLRPSEKEISKYYPLKTQKGKL